MQDIQRTQVDGMPEAADKVQQKAMDAADRTKEQVHELADTAQTQVRSMAAERKGQAASQLSGIAEAFRNSSQALHDQDQDAVARYTEQAADKLEYLAHYIQERNVDELLGDTERFARQQPELFLGGAFALGLLAARFFKSSNERREQARWEAYQDSYRNSYPRDGYERL